MITKHIRASALCVVNHAGEERPSLKLIMENAKLVREYSGWKVSKYRVFSGPYFQVIGLDTEIYFVNLRIQSKYRKIWTKKNPTFLDTFYAVNILSLLYESVTDKKVLLFKNFG